MKHYLTLVVCCSAFLLGYAQVNPEKEIGSWYMFYGTYRVSDKFSMNTGIEFRYYEVITNYNLDLFGAGVSYRLNPKTALTVNYSYLDIDRSIEFSNITNTIEHRLYEQILFNQKLWNLPINHRLRLEHRFLHTMRNNTIQNRLRYRFGTNIKLNKIFSLVLSNEFFANFRDEIFRENRAIAALGINLHDGIKLQLGYLKHHINNLNLNRLQFGIYVNTDFRKTSQPNK